MDFAEAYGVQNQGYCHLVVATMAVVMFGGMCRYDDASRLQWKNVRFVEDGGGFEVTFDKRKNAQFRQGNKVLVAANPSSFVLLSVHICASATSQCGIGAVHSMEMHASQLAGLVHSRKPQFSGCFRTYS